MRSNCSPSEQEMRKLEERIEKNEKDSKAIASSYAVEKERMEVRVIEMEQEAGKERERIEAERDQQLADLDHHFQDAINASARDPARLEQEVRDERQRARDELADLGRRLQDATSASAADRAGLEQEAKEREEREAEHNRQLADLTRRLQDDTNVSAAYRTRLEEKIKELQDRMTAAYVRVLFCSVTRND